MPRPLRFAIKKGSLVPALRVTLLQADGTPVPGNLTAVKFRMRSKRSNALKVDDANGTLVDAPNKVVEYQWAGTDTDTIGTYDAEFEATIDGRKGIFPAANPGEDGALEVEVTEPYK